MNCPKCNEENDLDCASKCWKCGTKLEGSGASTCSVEVARRVFRLMLNRAADEPEHRRDFIYIWLEQTQIELIKELQQNPTGQEPPTAKDPKEELDKFLKVFPK